MFSSETYSIEDCSRYDNALSDNTSKYDTTYSSGQSFVWDSTNTAYKITRASNGFGAILVDNVTAPQDVELSYDFKISGSGNNIQPRLCLYDENNNGIGFTYGYLPSNYNNFTVDTVSLTGNGNPTLISQKQSFSTNTWYRLILSVENGTVTASVYQGDTLVRSETGTTSQFTTDNNKVGILMAFSSGGILHFKNLKVKPL